MNSLQTVRKKNVSMSIGRASRFSLAARLISSQSILYSSVSVRGGLREVPGASFAGSKFWIECPGPMGRGRVVKAQLPSNGSSSSATSGFSPTSKLVSSPVFFAPGFGSGNGSCLA